MEVQISGVLKHSLVNGPGVRYCVFFQGCKHNCPECQNPETHDPSCGQTMDIADIIADMSRTKCLDGLTISGGDPMLQPEACAALASAAHELGLDAWVYTGYRYEDIIDGTAGTEARAALRHIDVLVDGRFVSALKSDACLWRGSTNQRLVDVQNSLKNNKTILREER